MSEKIKNLISKDHLTVFEYACLVRARNEFLKKGMLDEMNKINIKLLSYEN
jgi:hypothetical protein